MHIIIIAIKIIIIILIIIIIIILIIIITLIIILIHVEFVPVVIGALGSITKEYDRWIEKLGITCNVGVRQKAALLGTARILQKVLEM